MGTQQQYNPSTINKLIKNAEHNLNHKEETENICQ